MTRPPDDIEQLEQEVDRVTSEMGPDDPETLQAQHMLGVAYGEAGRWGEAVAAQEQAAEARARVLGNQAPDTLASRHALAGAYARSGRWEDAIRLLEDTSQMRAKVLGEEHSDTLLSVGNLATAYAAVGRPEDSVPVREQLAETLTRIFGREDRRTLAARRDLGSTYSAVKRVDEAIELLESTAREQDEVLGDTDPETLQTRQALAGVYSSIGRWEESIALLQRTIEFQREALGPEHFDTVVSQLNLAGVYAEAGQYSDAVPLLEELIPVLERELGAESQLTLRARGSLGIAYLNSGELEAAISLLSTMAATDAQALGDEDIETLRARHHLAMSYAAVGRPQEAIPLLEQTVDARIRILGPEHPDTTASQGALLDARRAAGEDAAPSEPEPQKVEPAAPHRPRTGELRDLVDWVSDHPVSGTADTLQRKPLAIEVAKRLRRMHEEAAGASFLVHIDGPWGAGKSSLLNFLREDMKDPSPSEDEARPEDPDEPKESEAAETTLGRAWLVVDFNAWQASRIGPPWWALLMTLRRSISEERSPPRRLVLRAQETWRRGIRTGTLVLVTAAILGLVPLALGLWALVALDLIEPSVEGLGGAAKALSAVVAAALLVFSATNVVGRFLLWDSARGAKAFEQAHANPHTEIAKQFEWLVSRAGRPVLFLVDDLDRCQADYVVQLLEATQTVVRTFPSPRDREADSNWFGPHFVVAADGQWIRTSYEVAYESFAGTVSEPGRPLGYLFLDKVFQLSVTIPSLGATDRDRYLRSLLGGSEPELADDLAAAAERGRGAIKASLSETDVLSALTTLPPAIRVELAPEALARMSTPAVEAETEHALQKFHRLVDPNPRGMKRFLNSYSMRRAVRTVEGDPVPRDPLAIWTIVELRWPELADYLRKSPASAVDVRSGRAPPTMPAALRSLSESAEVQTTLAFDDGDPLTPAMIRRCCGLEPLASP